MASVSSFGSFCIRAFALRNAARRCVRTPSERVHCETSATESKLWETGVRDHIFEAVEKVRFRVKRAKI